MHLFMLHSINSLFCLFTCIFLPALAGDLSSDIRKGSSGPESNDGGYFEIGIGLVSFTSPIIGIPEGNSEGEVYTGGFLDINARYQHQGFFVEFFSQSINQPTLGYNFNNNDTYSVDWVGQIQHGEMSEKENKDYKGLNKRYMDFMSGPRATVYIEKMIVQLHLLTDLSNTHNGQIYSLKLARYWQHRNWTFHGIIGTTYRSKKINDYYYSIAESETSEAFPEYYSALASGVIYISELGTTYPLSEKWVFRGFIRRFDIDSNANNSPLIVSNHGESIAASISYVF